MNGAQIDRFEREDRSKQGKGSNRDWEGFKRPKNNGKGESRHGTRNHLNNLRRNGGSWEDEE